MKTVIALVTSCCALAQAVAVDSGAALWRIGIANDSAAEFALANNQYAQFLQRFGSPDRAFYIGLSKLPEDWPCVLPGPMDDWAGSGSGGRWDQMNTLPIGFVLDTVPKDGQCAFVVDVCDAQAKHPPLLRATINGVIREIEIPAGGSGDSLKSDYSKAKAHTARIEFPASLLHPGYNEIALRVRRGSWLLFDALHLETPPGVLLAAPSATVVRSVSSPPYAISAREREQATIRVEAYQHKQLGKIAVEIGEAKAAEFDLEPGLQVLEIPARASREESHQRSFQRERADAVRKPFEPESLAASHTGGLRGCLQRHGALALDDCARPLDAFQHGEDFA
jgi:hypothetical protein